MNEDIIEIGPVKRETSKIVIGLAGQTGEGKTFSALMLALGLADMTPSRIGMLDTEGRASLNDQIFKDVKGIKGDYRFLNGILSAPFSPSRYVAALNQFSKKDIDVIVVDSCSQILEGTGGLEEIANAPKKDGSQRRMSDWLTAKREHRKFMNTLLYMPFHVIVCLRAREKMDFKNPEKPVSRGIQPICEKNFAYELTASFLMKDKGRIHEELKLPECLRHILGKNGYFTPNEGKELKEWVGGGGDPMEKAKNRLRLAASEGMEALGHAWSELDKDSKKALSTFKDTLKDLATHADNERVVVKGVSSEPEPEIMEEKW